MVWTLEHHKPEVRKTRDLRFSLDLLFLSGAGPFVSLDLSFLICKMGSMDRIIFQGPVMIIHLLCSFKLLFTPLVLALSTPSFSPLPSLSIVSLSFFYPSSSCFPPLPSHLLLFIFSLSALPSTSSSSSFPPPPRFLSPADPTLFSPGYLLNSTHACTDGINPRLPCLQLISAPND